MSSTEPATCDAVVHAGQDDEHRCRYHATHRHRVAGGTLHVCGRHFEMLVNRRELGTVDDVLGEWGYTDAPHTGDELEPVMLDAPTSLAHRDANAAE